MKLYTLETKSIENLENAQLKGLQWLISFCAVLFVVILVSYGIILFTFKRMLRTLNSSILSSKTRIMQRQLMILMFLQVCL